MTIKEITKFVTDDGEEFDTREKAENHESIEWLADMILNAGLPEGGGYKEDFCQRKAAKMLLDRFFMRERRYVVIGAGLSSAIFDSVAIGLDEAKSVASYINKNFDLIAKS
jgi:hypothetical protein